MSVSQAHRVAKRKEIQMHNARRSEEKKPMKKRSKSDQHRTDDLESLSQSSNGHNIQRLRNAVEGLPSGLISEDRANEILSLLADCWDQIQGTDTTAMFAYKLERAERLSWNPPCLVFIIERHGAAQVGSTRAELQEWSVN